MSGTFLAELRAGRFRWGLVHPFPEQAEEDRATSAAALADLLDLLAARVDAEAVEAAAELPDGIVAELTARGYLSMTVPREDGGLGFSPLTTFRLLAGAAGWCVPVGLVLSWHNVLGLGAYLPALPAGPLRDMLAKRLADGAVFGTADTEPGGAAASARRRTVAVPTGDGRGFLLTGEKCFIGNGSIADLLAVSATTVDDGDERIDLFVVDTGSQGFSVVARHDFMGLRGSPNAALRLDRVFVPAEHVLVATTGGWRASPLVARINARARMNITVAPSVALARRCLDWSRHFLARRSVDGRPLGEYDAIQRRLAASVADVYALDCLVEWCLLGEHGEPEYMAAKNIGTVTSWRVIDRTMSLLGAEGYESASSKARRGAPDLPLERAFRDVRAMLIAGGVDFNIDMRAGRYGILPAYYAAGSADSEPVEPVDPDAAALSPANRRHLVFVRDQVAAFAARCRELTAAHPPAELYERQEVLIALSRLADELFTMSLVLARTAGPTAGSGAAQHVADVYCAGARTRIAGLWRDMETVHGADHAAVSRAWLAGDLAGLL